jgi:hypothetical protein
LEECDIALNKQIHIYSVDTSAFYNENEKEIHQYMNKLYILRKKVQLFLKKKNSLFSQENKDKYGKYITNINKYLKFQKGKLCKQFKDNKSIRELDGTYINKYNVVSVFESVLTRTMSIPENTLITDLMIVQTYFFDVIEDIILEGYLFNGERYVCLTASAGQIRTKKTVFIKENLLNKHQKTLMCGLTIDDINNLGGVNINKYLAYLALCNSATDNWDTFDINRSIVVDDFETFVKGQVDFIDDSTYLIHRGEMLVPITHTDGCGIMLTSVSNKNFMTRLPWIKGLLSPFAFDKFIKINNGDSKIKDIYGKEWDIFEDDIRIIFTKSQFKMWKYYNSWQDYKDKFEKYKCHAGICNIEEDTFSDAKINYQMLQTLTEMEDSEIELLATKTINDIYRAGSDRRTMLKILGVTKSNVNKNYFQQALELYPQLLCDTYSKEIIKQTKKSMVKEARAGKLEIKGKYTFIIPDLYAFCEYLFLDNKDPDGLLMNGEVFCNLYRDTDKLDCLRSPHLYREHAIRKNVVDDEKGQWLTTNGLYTSCHDLISKILQFDVDGDKSLVCAEKTLISVAERHMNNVVPLYYNMRKAKAEKVDKHSIYNGLVSAYTGGNIGMISNDITKIWNSHNINLNVIKLLCMENNFTIDFAKTLYKPTRPADKKKLITSYTKAKVPHFFIYAKDKEKNKVEPINNSLVNRLEKIIKNPRIKFETKDIGEFNYRMLMKNKQILIDQDIVNKYKQLDLSKRFITIESEEDDTSDNIYIYKDIRKQLLEVNSDVYYVVDVLIEYLYEQKKSSYKTTLWSSFGDIIVENLKGNILTGNIYCKRCGDLVEITNNKNHSQEYCQVCSMINRKEKVRKNVENFRKRKKCNQS